MLRNLYISGYRSYELGVFADDDPKVTFIKLAIKERLIQDLDRGLEWVLIGGQLGTELWAGQVVMELKEEYPGLQLAVILPYQDFGNQWNEKNQGLLLSVTQAADFVAHTSKDSYQNPGQLQAHQVFMIEHTQKALLLYDREYPGKSQYDLDLILKRQETQDYELELITMFDLQDTVEQENLKNQGDY